MDKKVIYIGVGVIVLLLIGAGAYLVMSKSSTPATPLQTVNTQNEPAQSAQNAPALKSLKDLLTAGVAQKCTYQDTSTAANVSGTTYISAGKVRSDFTSVTSNITISGHMVADGKTSYVWMDGQTTGFKMAFDQASTASAGSAQQGVDANKAMNYSCSAWVVDNTLFTPPTSVKFTDLGALTVPSADSQCSTCNALSGEAQTQCKTALKCP